MDVSDIISVKGQISGRFLPLKLKRRSSYSPTMMVSEAVQQASSNVHSIGVGFKEVEDGLTDVMCIRFHVAQKLPLSMLGKNRIPKEIDGVVTDVVESMPAFFSNCTQQRKKRQRPFVAGISAAIDTVTTGTISCFCSSTKEGDSPDDVYLLSNNHVFADVNRGKPGAPILQPGVIDGGTPEDKIAELSRFYPLNTNSGSNIIDAAIAKVDPGIAFDQEICSIGKVKGTNPATALLKVKKHGRTSGYTEGSITDLSLDVNVGLDHNNPSKAVLFQDQLRIHKSHSFSSWAQFGDSGSLVLDMEDRAVGLYFAGPANGVYGIANRIEEVIKRMEIKLL